MSNINDLNELLFSQLNRLNSASKENLDMEIERAKAVSGVAKDIISNARLAFDAAQLRVEYGVQAKLPAMLELKHERQ